MRISIARCSLVERHRASLVLHAFRVAAAYCALGYLEITTRTRMRGTTNPYGAVRADEYAAAEPSYRYSASVWRNG